MSGICGMFRFDGKAPLLGPILDKLERRGPDATRSWGDGPVALGHTLLATTREALVEDLPLTDKASGCTITADARLDSREELIAALGLGSETRTIGDGELILRAYLLWGEDCPTHLLGDFAFSIWDPRHQRLFCARDHMGMRQLIYHHKPGKLLAFATDVEALIAHPDVPNRINEGRIADFLDDLEGIDLTSTFFEDVVRLPPAHTLTLDAKGLSLRRYWTLQAGPELKLDSDQAYADAFLGVFTEAVRCRLRSAGPVGSMLSGGVDSNSVVAVATRLLAADGRTPLATFSAIGSDPSTCAETRAIDAAIGGLDVTPTRIDHSDGRVVDDHLIRLTKACGEPFDGHMTMIRAIYRAAHSQGVKVMLDGVGGDVILTSGNRVAELLRRRRLIKALHEARSERHFWGPTWNAAQKFFASAWAAWAPGWVRVARRQWKWQVNDRRALAGKARFAGDFARAIDLRARRARFRAHSGPGLPIGAPYRAASVGHPHLVVGRERYDRVAAEFAIEPRDPFLDIRLVAFCLSLPSAQLQDGGWPKLVLRRAMEGIVSPKILWRRGKEHLGWAFTQSLIRHWTSDSVEETDRSERLARYLSPATRSDWAVKKACDMDMERLFELGVLSNWLYRNTGANESETRDGE